LRAPRAGVFLRIEPRPLMMTRDFISPQIVVTHAGPLAI
jgi:hypothetical protein